MPKIHRNQADRSIINDKSFVFEQGIPSNEWYIVHNLNKRPSVTVVDEDDRVVVPDVQYLDDNTIVVTLNATLSGKAYLN